MSNNKDIFNDFAPEVGESESAGNPWKILIVDDKEDVHKTTVFALKNFFYEGRGLQFLRAYNNLGAKAHIENNTDIAVVLLDVVMDENGLKLVPYIRENPETAFMQIILRTGEPDEAPEREVVEKFEINDYIAKPEATQDRLFTSVTASLRAYKNLINLEEHKKELIRLNMLLKEDNSSLKQENKRKQDQIEDMKDKLLSKEMEARIGKKFIGVSSKIKEVKDKALRVAKFNECVLISGENGSGKEIIAHLIHHASSRKDKPFLAFNCTAISENLVESVLFGHKKGSFTGAISDNKGYFASAQGGSLFIDEIGEMDMNMQVKLLRAIEYNEVIPVGANGSVPVDARIIAATNKDLKKMVEEGRFREDLYYRINTSHIMIPPLRERPDDIRHLLTHFTGEFAEKYNVLLPNISEEVVKFLLDYKYPGNVRELKNIIFNALINSGGEDLTLMNFEFLKQKMDSRAVIDADDNTLASALNLAKRNAIIQAKEMARTGKVSEICEILDIPKANYYRYLKELDL